MITFLTLTRQFFFHTTSIDIINSWGISKMYATQIVKNVNGENSIIAALVKQVNGFQFQGKVYIALDEGSDYYRFPQTFARTDAVQCKNGCSARTDAVHCGDGCSALRLSWVLTDAGTAVTILIREKG